MKITFKQKIILLFFMIIIVSVISIRSYVSDKKEVYILSNMEEREGTEVEKAQKHLGSSEPNSKIVIHIEGEVIHPGIYKLQQDARIYDAVELAGGLKNTADRSRINLAKKIFDEEFIYIPSREDENISNLNTGVGISSNNSKININRANQSELETLTGIGSALANRIVDYRETEGPFQSIEEIQRVSGIGEAKFRDIQDNITVN